MSHSLTYQSQPTEDYVYEAARDSRTFVLTWTRRQVGDCPVKASRVPISSTEVPPSIQDEADKHFFGDEEEDAAEISFSWFTGSKKRCTGSHSSRRRTQRRA